MKPWIFDAVLCMYSIMTFTKEGRLQLAEMDPELAEASAQVSSARLTLTLSSI
jgi:hypothetical protein